MMTTITVGAKVVGQRKALFNDWQVPLPPDLDGSSRVTLRDLITLVVQNEVQAFRTRQEERKLAKVLSAAEIEQGAAKGKIDMGERDLQQEVDEQAAIGAALQAFEDGFYYVFLDDVQQENLESTVFVGSESHLMFIRLVPLVGG
ncbi:MAG: hypothetical protein K8L91_22585 [Anaerolineae bacterium]|nr:hypothetical protein [Anaerolineae bacterium]